MEWRSPLYMPRDGSPIIALLRDDEYEWGTPVYTLVAICWREFSDGGTWTGIRERTREFCNDEQNSVVGWIPFPKTDPPLMFDFAALAKEDAAEKKWVEDQERKKAEKALAEVS